MAPWRCLAARDAAEEQVEKPVHENCFWNWPVNLQNCELTGTKSACKRRTAAQAN